MLNRAVRSFRLQLLSPPLKNVEQCFQAFVLDRVELLGGCSIRCDRALLVRGFVGNLTTKPGRDREGSRARSVIKFYSNEVTSARDEDVIEYGPPAVRNRYGCALVSNLAIADVEKGLRMGTWDRSTVLSMRLISRVQNQLASRTLDGNKLDLAR